MQASTTNVVQATRGGIRSLFRRSDLSIRLRLTTCFILIVLLMIAADAVAVWQYRQIEAPAQRLSKTDQISHAFVRVHLDVDTFRDSIPTLAGSHDTRQFSSEAAAIRQTFLQHVEHARQMLRATPDVEQGPSISTALESLQVTLLSQLDTAVQLATAGEWNAVQLRLAVQIPALIEFSSLLVQRVDQEAQQQRSKVMEDAQKARQRFFIIVPIAALLTLLAAAALGWFVTRTITGPLSVLTACAGALARGDFQHSVHLRGNNELAALGSTFNYAAQQLQKLYGDLQQSERELRRSEAYLAEGQRLTHTGSWALNVATGEPLYSSAEHTRLFGLDPENGTPSFEEFFQRVHPEDRGHVLETFQTLARSGGDLDLLYRIAAPGYPVRYLHAIGHPDLKESGTPGKYVGVTVDITERKRADQERERLRQLEADLAHMNRVSMLGELSASLAHEIRQPITAITTSADACLSWLTRNPPDLERARLAVTRINEDGTRAADVISRLRSFYKKGAPSEREKIDVNEIVREMIVMLQNETFRRAISIRPVLAEAMPKIMADRVQLQQVLMNLMLNAIDAMKDTSGEMTITSQFNDDGQCLISVSDAGVGLPAEGGDRIFDAFYTTKPHGTGMGLAITRSIVESHGGRVWATANEGPGATFHFTLSATAEAHA